MPMLNARRGNATRCVVATKVNRRDAASVGTTVTAPPATQIIFLTTVSVQNVLLAKFLLLGRNLIPTVLHPNYLLAMCVQQILHVLQERAKISAAVQKVKPLVVRPVSVMATAIDVVRVIIFLGINVWHVAVGRHLLLARHRQPHV